MSFQISLEHLTNDLVDQLLIDHGSDKALHFHYDVRMSVYKNGREYRQSRGIHLLYYKPKGYPKGYGAVTVFSAVLDNPFDKIDKVEDSSWIHEGTHDSCWKEVKAFFGTYKRMADEINAELEVNGYDSVAPVHMQQHNSFALFGKAFQWVDVEVTKEPGKHKRTVYLLKKD